VDRRIDVAPYGIELPEGWKLRVQRQYQKIEKSLDRRRLLFMLTEPRFPGEIDLWLEEYRYLQYPATADFELEEPLPIGCVSHALTLLRIAAGFHKRSRYGKRSKNES